MTLLTGESAAGQTAAADPAAGNSDGGAAAAGTTTAPATVVGGTSGVPASGTSAGTDWRTGLSAEFKDNQLLGNFKSLDSMVKSYLHQNQLVGKKGVIVPGEKASDEERAAFWDQIGRPALDKYDINKPEGADIPDEVLTMLKAEAFKIGVLPKQAEALLKWNHDLNTQSEAQVAKELADEAATQLSDLKKEWGQGFDKNVANAQFAVTKMDDEQKSFSKYLAETGLGNDVKLIRHLAKMGEMFATLTKEDTMKGAGGSFGRTPAEINNEIQRLTAHPGYADATHGDHKRLVAETAALFKMRSEMNASKSA